MTIFMTINMVSHCLLSPPKGLVAHAQLPSHQPVPLRFNQKGHHPVVRLELSCYIPSKYLRCRELAKTCCYQCHQTLVASAGPTTVPASSESRGAFVGGNCFKHSPLQ